MHHGGRLLLSILVQSTARVRRRRHDFSNGLFLDLKAIKEWHGWIALLETGQFRAFVIDRRAASLVERMILVEGISVGSATRMNTMWIQCYGGRRLSIRPGLDSDTTQDLILLKRYMLFSSWK